MKKQILHVVTDPSFMSFTSKMFEDVLPGASKFVAVDFEASQMGLPECAKIEGLASDRAGIAALNRLISESRIVIFHRVTPAIAQALASAPSSVLRVWSGWGGDYYGTTFNGLAGLLNPGTRHLVYGAVNLGYWVERARVAVQFSSVLHAAARATDIFSAPIPEDLEVFRQRFHSFQGKFKQLNYVSIEDSIASGPDYLLGNDILVGNSASPTNNHLEVLEMLSSQDLSDRRVLVPLSYGKREYADSVVDAGHALLGEHFVPIMEFLPVDRYHELVANCGVSVFGHLRQEGVGNILRTLWQGGQLVLDRRSPVVRYLQARGVEVTFLDDVSARGLPTGPISEEQVAAHREMLTKNWGHSAVIDNIRALVELAW